MKKLTCRAFPGIRDTLALDYFIDAIPESEIRLRLREVGPKTINEAENIAVRLEALRMAHEFATRPCKPQSDVLNQTDFSRLQPNYHNCENRSQTFRSTTPWHPTKVTCQT
jgi:O-succinylbenzoate synthase